MNAVLGPIRRRFHDWWRCGPDVMYASELGGVRDYGKANDFGIEELQ
jgi:hypothetical protein